MELTTSSFFLSIFSELATEEEEVVDVASKLATVARLR